MPHSFREWEDFLFHFETGKEGFRLREARGEEGESERGCCFRSYSKARSNASCWHEQGTEGEWIYSIGFQRKRIRLATLKIHHIDYYLDGLSRSSHRFLKGQTLRYTLIDAHMAAAWQKPRNNYIITLLRWTAENRSVCKCECICVFYWPYCNLPELQETMFNHCNTGILVCDQQFVNRNQGCYKSLNYHILIID